eukprot:4008424-Prymnesium_polylepis.1
MPRPTPRRASSAPHGLRAPSPSAQATPLHTPPPPPPLCVPSPQRRRSADRMVFDAHQPAPGAPPAIDALIDPSEAADRRMGRAGAHECRMARLTSVLSLPAPPQRAAPSAAFQPEVHSLAFVGGAADGGAADGASDDGSTGGSTDGGLSAREVDARAGAAVAPPAFASCGKAAA